MRSAIQIAFDRCRFVKNSMRNKSHPVKQKLISDQKLPDNTLKMEAMPTQLKNIVMATTANITDKQNVRIRKKTIKCL